MRRADELGCRLVRNPRSNSGNRVAHARSLRARGRVALGNDGYPSDLGIEPAALRQEAAHHGDDPDAAARRARQGRALLDERFGGRAPAPGASNDIDFDAIRAQAAAQAPRLWSRMADQ